MLFVCGRFSWSRCRRVFLGSVGLLLSGCNSEPERVPVFPASGKVTVNGAPAAGVAVALHPAESNPHPQVRAFGTTDAFGSFTLSTYGAADGAPEGAYTVTASWRKPLPLAPDSDDAVELGPEQVPATYQTPATSSLKVAIAAQPSNDLGVLQISGEPPAVVETPAAVQPSPVRSNAPISE